MGCNMLEISNRYAKRTKLERMAGMGGANYVIFKAHTGKFETP